MLDIRTRRISTVIIDASETVITTVACVFSRAERDRRYWFCGFAHWNNLAPFVPDCYAIMDDYGNLVPVKMR